MTQDVAVEAMAHDALRAVREARHNRNMQLVLSTPKPVVPVQKMEVERSLSVRILERHVLLPSNMTS